MLGQTSFTFKDMLGLHYTGCTPEDISKMLDLIKRHKEREEIRNLDKEFKQEAIETWSLMSSDEQMAPCLEMDYNTLFQGLVNEFPNAINIHNVMKTIDRDVLQRLHDGGAMTRNVWMNPMLYYSQSSCPPHVHLSVDTTAVKSSTKPQTDRFPSFAVQEFIIWHSTKLNGQVKRIWV